MTSMEGMDSAQIALEWKKRYLQMEGKLKQFRIQATNIKLKLSTKMEELTIKCEQAEEKAEDAEYQLNLLRESLAGVPGAADQEERFCREKLVMVEERCLELLERNASLEKELEYERYLRKLEKDSLHEKAVRIKEWVSGALGTAEQEKEELRASNHRLTAAVQAMQQRLKELLETSSSPSAKRRSGEIPLEHDVISKDVAQTTDIATARPLYTDCWQSNPLFGDLAQDDDESSADSMSSHKQSHSPLSMDLEHCEEHERVKTRSEDAKSSDKQKRKDKDNVTLQKSPRSMSIKAMGDRDTFPPVVEGGSSTKKKSSTLPMAKAHHLTSVAVATSSPTSRSTPNTSHSGGGGGGHHFMGTFGSIRRRIKGLTEHHHHHNRHRSHEDQTPISPSRGREKRDKQRSKSKSPAPRSNSSSRTRSSPVAVPKSDQHPGGNSSPSLPAILQEEEDMLVDPPQPSSPVVLFSTSLPANSPGWKGLHANNNRPPTPPLHRLPSWETKIYEMAKTGFKLPTNVFGKTASHKHPGLVDLNYEPGEFVRVVCKVRELNIPVYTKIKGRATQIRPMPFTDASDSSDDDRSLLPVSSPRHLSPRHHHAQRPSRSLTRSGEIPLLPNSSFSSSSSSSAAMQQRKNGSPGLTRAFKRANSQQSMASSEGDYAIPPDAQYPPGYSPVTLSDPSEPEHKLLKTSRHQSTSSIPRGVPASPTTKPHATPEGETGAEAGTLKCGYLGKLGGRVRTWKKRWFVLKGGALFYYKSPNDVHRKPQGQISLLDGGGASISQSDVSFQVLCGKHTYYLNADSSKCARDWVRALRAVVRDRSASPGGSKDKSKATTGWLTRTIGGSSCHVWAVVRDGTLEFYENESAEEMPLSRLSLSGCAVESARLNLHAIVTGTGHARAHSPPPGPEHVIVVRPISGREGPDVFLSFESGNQKASWLQKLTSAARDTSSTSSSSSDVNAHVTKPKVIRNDPESPQPCSEFERLMVKLVQADSRGASGASGTIWRNPVLSYSQQGISRPLTSLTSDALRTEAMKMSKSVQLFANVSLDAASVDYHVTLAQGVARSCLTHAVLRDELYAQLIKLTNRREADTDAEAGHSYLQSWKLVSLVVPLFLPRDKMLMVLRAHLSRHASPKTEVGQYVSYCQRAAERSSAVGGRSAAPSRTECLSILLQNPYQHSRPFSVPIHFADGSYQVVSFDGSSTVSELSHRVTVQAGLRHQTTSGFALYVNDPDPTAGVTEHFVEPTAKICDVISTWETHSRHGAVMSKGAHLPHDGVGEQSRITARFTFKRRLNFRAYRRMETEKEKLLLLYQIADDLSRDRFPVTRELAIEMTSLAAQVHFGDRARARGDDDPLGQAIRRFLPARYRDTASKHQTKQLRERVGERWVALRGTSSSEAARIFLNVARKWPLCGATLFLAKVETSGKHKGDLVWLTVTEDCLSVLNHRTMETTDRCEYADIVTFGGCKDSFMAVAEMAGVSRKLFFALGKVQMFELVSLMADYMNASPSFSAKLRPRKASS